MLEIVYGKRCKQRNKLFENSTNKICNCRSCFMTRAIRKSFEDPAKHEAWKERTRLQARAMRAAVKNPYKFPSGSQSPVWKGGKPKCQNCGEICGTYEATICKQCWLKTRPKGQASPNWVGGKRECMDCKAPLKNAKTKRCKPCGYKAREGAGHPLWKGGVSTPSQKARNTHEHRLWSKSVLRRDDFTCQLCKERGGTLHAHHKKRWADHKELRFDVNNGVTLCRDCHLNKVHQGKWSNIPLNFWESQ